MRRPVSVVFGSALTVAGLLIALFPAISVWRVSGRVLDELPTIPAAASDDDRHRVALVDDDFVLATRNLDGVAADEVLSALRAKGFQSMGVADGAPVLFKECCGDYDAVLATVRSPSPGEVVVELTAADADVQAAAPIFIVIGLLLALSGTVIVLGRVGSGRGHGSGTPPAVERATIAG